MNLYEFYISNSEAATFNNNYGDLNIFKLHRYDMILYIYDIIWPVGLGLTVLMGLMDLS